MDSDRDVEVLEPDGFGFEYAELKSVRFHEHWRPFTAEDTRPFTLPPAPAPATSTERRIVQLACHPKGTAVYAVADDGTAWIATEITPEWSQLASLPNRE
ncbi:MAG: hypothetical protein VKN56_08500 [Cyanobacteriota bacterium]|nr:hypothetical protein [Cyanobacteriota bacterium]